MAPQPYPYGDITVVELVPLNLRFVWLGFLLIYKVLAFPFSHQYTFKRTLWRTFVRTVAPNSTLRQMQWVSPRVAVMYERFINSSSGKNLEIIHEDVGEGASLHWIGPKKNEHTILYLHGGGYVLPALDGHFLMVDYWRTEAKRKYGVNLSVAFLEYSLINHAPWPAQLHQGILAVNHILTSGIPPSALVIAGDSAGGHLIAALFAHMLHPHPSGLPSVTPLAFPLAGAALISPWMSFSEAAPSFARNAHRELLPLKTLRRWADLIKASRPVGLEDGPWFEPATAEPDWWAGLAGIVEHILYAAGDGEVMVDDAVVAAERMREGAGKKLQLDVFIQPGGGHNEPLAEMASGEVPGVMSQRVVDWLGELWGQ
ncbi:Alpha/Beta hydrolase protein [Mycena maculata]|uniref:Alpha/Beta hydrolase protein n=1 Tax=Mycena maculata TaxID=230809 RepID=A0AAD7HLB3_9AGAR|nr:Alpha/Beta hydrolase protein [Mycena maculata]